MALINCPECGKEISDSAVSCPNCGFPLKPTIAPEDSSGAEEESTVEVKKKSKKLPIIIGIVIVAVVVVVLALVIHGRVVSNNESASRAEYIENLTEARVYMLTGAADAESLCNLTKSVWYNTIYEEWDISTNQYTRTDGAFNEDFNDSLNALYSDESTLEAISDIKENQEIVADYFRLLQNPPEDLVSCYEVLDDMYDVYLDFTALAISPTGSLSSYSSDFSSYDSDFMTLYTKLGNLIPDE